LFVRFLGIKSYEIGIINHGKLIAEGTLDELRVRSGEERGNLETVFLELTEDADRDRDRERDFAVL
jgi:ABC-type multidrug transport system ATPase subunit